MNDLSPVSTATSRVRVPAAFRSAGFVVLLVSLASPAGAQDVLTLLETHCVACHGGEKTKAGLNLTNRAALLRGGESGSAIDPGKPETSLLFRMVAHLEEPRMPHKKDPLPPDAVKTLADWIRAGAPYARTLQREPANGTKPEFAISAADRAHWAFQPVQRLVPPDVANPGWVRTPIDRFILAALDAKGLAPSPAAGRETLIRRVTLDVIGLPPRPDEIDAFARDPAPDAYERLVDRLLASPHYGERWGRHWLDLARFAESDGFEHDAIRPHAWRYRDYVIRAFNADKPYDRFLREQIAGDELYPDEPDALIATGFNLLGPDMVDSADQVQRRRNTLNDMTDTTALAFLGLTVGCARCHDHKFEPIAQRDYYRLQAFFTPARLRSDLPVPTAAERASHAAALAVYHGQTQGWQQQIAALDGPYRQKLYERKLARLSPEAQAAHRTEKEARTTEQENQIQETAAQLVISAKELAAAMNPTDRDRHKVLLAELVPFPKPPPLPAALALQAGPPAQTHLLHRGDYNQPGEEVNAGFPAILSQAEGPPVAPQRAALADWIAGPDHPLTARVMVNRVWQHHFGRGLVPTPSDFGTHGQKPTHPALLDWLASEFVAGGWSVKQLHRLMLLSATYRQASAWPSLSTDPGVSHQYSGQSLETERLKPSSTDYSSGLITDHAASWTKAVTLDPENRLYARMDRLRLEGEVIRDSLLAISGQLNPKAGGPGVFPPISSELFQGAKGWTPNADPSEHVRRSVYVFVRRNLRFPFLDVFDAPDSNLSCAGRGRSTTAPQSLTLLNADEVLTASARTAERIARETASADDRITLAYRLILGRVPTPKETILSRDFLARSPLPELCRALFNLNAFVYAD